MTSPGAKRPELTEEAERCPADVAGEAPTALLAVLVPMPAVRPGVAGEPGVRITVSMFSALEPSGAPQVRQNRLASGISLEQDGQAFMEAAMLTHGGARVPRRRRCCRIARPTTRGWSSTYDASPAWPRGPRSRSFSGTSPGFRRLPSPR